MKMIANMAKFGDAFERSLAETIDRASSVDYRKMSNVFSDYFEKFRAEKWKGVRAPHREE